jgi:hypothetical protein
MTPPFHPLRIKLPGDRVKLPRHAADESRGYYYGTVVRGKVSWYGALIPDAHGLCIQWDEPVPYLGSFSILDVAISDEPDPVWEVVDRWQDRMALPKQSAQIAKAD